MNDAQNILRQYWPEELGTPVDGVAGEVTVCEHGTLTGYQGVMAFRRNDACIFSVPPSVVEDFRRATTGKNSDDVWSVDFFHQVLGNRIDRIIGPGWLGEINRANFKPCDDADTHEIRPVEWPLFDTFINECPPENVDVSSLETGREPTVGVFRDDKIVCASGYELLGGKVAHIGILTHPEHRGQGHAKSAISAITKIAFTHPVGIQYWTLGSNTSSVGAAKSLGFTQFAETFGIRLK